MSLDTLAEADRKEIINTGFELNLLFNQELNELAASSARITLPFPVVFPKGSVDSLPAPAVANSLRELNQRQELLIAVEPGFTGPLFNVCQCSIMKQGRVTDARFIGAFFVGNFIARCRIEAPDPAVIVERAIVAIAYQDVLMTAQNLPRAAVHRSHPEDLVHIYAGPKYAERPQSGLA